MPGWVLCIGLEFACIAGVYPDDGASLGGRGSKPGQRGARAGKSVHPLPVPSIPVKRAPRAGRVECHQCRCTGWRINSSKLPRKSSISSTPGPLGILLPLCPQKPWQPGQVAGGHCQDEARPHPFNATIDGLGHAADGLGPAEGLLDPLSMLDGQGIALVSSGSSVDCRMPRFLGDMRGVTQAPRRSATKPAAS